MKKCLICGLEIDNLCSHIENSHNMAYMQYYRKYRWPQVYSYKEPKRVKRPMNLSRSIEEAKAIHRLATGEAKMQWWRKVKELEELQSGH